MNSGHCQDENIMSIDQSNLLVLQGLKAASLGRKYFIVCCVVVQLIGIFSKTGYTQLMTVDDRLSDT